MAEQDKKGAGQPKQQPQKAPPRPLPDVSNKELLADLEAISKQISSAEGGKRIDMAAKVIELSIQAVKTEDKKTALAAYKTLRSIQGEISTLAFQSEEEQKRFHDLYGETLKSAEKSSSMLGVIAHDLADNTKKMLPTLSSFGKQLASNTHPALKIAYDIAKETKTYLGDAKKRSDDANKEGQKAALTEAEVLLQQSKVAEDQTGLMEKQEQLVDAQNEGLKEEREERKERAKERKEGPLVQRMEAVRANTEAQIGLLQTLLDTLGVERKQDEAPAVKTAPAEKEVTAKLVEQERKPGGDSKPLDKVVDSGPQLSEGLKGISTQLGDAQEGTSAMLDRLESQINELNHANATLEHMDQTQQQSNKLQQDMVKRQEMEKLKLMEDNKGRSQDKAGFLERAKPKEDKGGFLSNMVGELLGNVLGMGAPKIIGSMLKPLSKIAGPALKAVPVVGTVITGVMALFDFFDGFNNASDILGKEDVNLFDKISAGIGSVLGGLTSIIDFTAGLFGFETDFAPKVKEHVAKFLSAIPDFIVETFDSMMGIFDEAKNVVTDKVSEVWDKVTSIFDDLLEYIPKMLMDAIPGAGLAKQGYDAVKGWFSNEPTKSEETKPLTPVEAPSRVESIRQQEQATVAAEQKAADDKVAQTASTVNAPITNNTRVDASSTSVYNQPMSSRNDDRSNWAGMGSRSRMV